MKPVLKRAINWIGYALLLIGLGAIIIAVAADVMHIGGETGFGGKQKALLVVGGLSITFGAMFWTRAGRRFLIRWLDPSIMDRQPLKMTTIQQKATFLLISAAWFGLVTGFLEIAYRFYNRLTEEKIISLSQHFIWMAPITYLVIFLLIGFLLLLLWLLIPKASLFGSAIFLYVFLGLMSVYYTSPTLYLFAVLIFALGISLQVSRFLVGRATLFYKSVRITLPWMVTGILAVAAFMLGFLR